MESSEPLRILMVGDGTVGKSQLLIRYLESRFDPSFTVTIGVNCQHVAMLHGGKRVHLQIWDAAGQERFRTITPAYYAKAHAVMIVYDITNHSSFKSVEYWKQQVDAHASVNVPVVVVGNKTDLVDEYTISLRVSGDDEEQLSDRLGVPVRPVSAKDGNGVDEAFNELITLAEQRCVTHTGQTFLRSNSRAPAALIRARNSLVQRCRWPLPKGRSRQSWLFKPSDPNPLIANDSTLKSQSNALSPKGAKVPKPVPLGVAKLGPEVGAEANFVDSGCDAGQTALPSQSQAADAITGVVSSYWIRIGPPPSPPIK